MTRAKLRERIYSKKIIIWGTGKQGQEFVQTYGHCFSKIYCTSNNMEECLVQIERIEMEEIIEHLQDYYIVICSSAYDEIAHKLISIGLIPVENFVPSKIFEAILTGKKLILGVGQCELEITNYIFNGMGSLSKKYISIYFDEYKIMGIQELSPKLEVVMTIRAIMPLADFFIYPVNLTKERRDYYADILLLTNEKCNCLSIPLSTFEAYWPQDNIAEYYDVSKYYYRNKNGKLPFGNRRDKNIEDAIENSDGKNILTKIMNENFYSLEQIEKLFERTIRKYMLLERIADLQISDFLLQNYKHRRLFKDRGHAEVFVLREYAKRILRYFEIEFVEDELEAVNLEWYDNCHTEFPIYPSVLYYLNWERDVVYRYMHNGIEEYLDFETYVSKIYEYLERSKSLNEYYL